MNKEKDISDKYDDLIKEFKDQRDALKLMIVDLEKIKARVDTLLPESLDKRYIRFFEEKIKSITELFRTILDMRKEIAKNAKDEFELRKKVSGPDNDDYEGVFDIRKIAQRVERLSMDKLAIEQKLTLPDEQDLLAVELADNKKGEIKNGKANWWRRNY